MSENEVGTECGRQGHDVVVGGVCAGEELREKEVVESTGLYKQNTCERETVSVSEATT